MNNFFLSSAENCADEIKKCLAKKGVKIGLKILRDRKPRYVFGIITRKSTSVSKLRSFIEDLQFYLRVPKVDIIENGSTLLLVVFTEQIESPNLIRALRRNEIFENRVIAHPVGVDDVGRWVIGDLAEYPHLLNIL